MEFEAVTASAAVGATRITIALFMLGMYLTARRDACTGYWAIASIFLGVGTLSPVYGGQLGVFGMWFASCMAITGGVCWWWGLRLLFGRSASVFGWWVIAGNAVFIGALLFLTDDQQPRLIGFALTVLLGWLLVVRETWIADGSPLTLSRGMVIAAFAVSTMSIAGRAIYFLVTDQPVTPRSDHPVSVALLYLVPLGCVILASVGTLLMYLERTVAEKEHLAQHDDLTRMFNRRAVANLGREVLASGQNDVSLLLIDVDHFKVVNDTLGHMAGDEVLCAIADALAANCRRTDVIGRHGGEEFCIVCPDTSLAQAQVLADRLLAAVAGMARPAGLSLPVSVSIGIAVSDADIGWDTMLRNADKALYAAKAAGRGQAITA